MGQLAEDNRRAQSLGHALSALQCERLSVEPVETNIVLCSIAGADGGGRWMVSRLAAHGVLGSLCREDAVRFVTHRHITDAHVAMTARCVAKALA